MTSPPSGASHTPWRRKLAWALRRSAKAKSASRKSALGAFFSKEGVKDESRHEADLSASLERAGQQVPVTVLVGSGPENWILVDGHRRVRALKREAPG